MTISPLTPNNMAVMAATHTAPARPSSEMNTDRGNQPQDDEFVAALEAASGSKSTPDATTSERTGEAERPQKEHDEKPEKDTGNRAALIGHTWLPIHSGMPPSDAAGALALPAALIAHGTLAAGHPSAGDITPDTPPVAVAGIGVVTEPGTTGTGPTPGLFALGAGVMQAYRPEPYPAAPWPRRPRKPPMPPNHRPPNRLPDSPALG